MTGKLARLILLVDNVALKVTLFVCGTILAAMVAIAGLGVVFRFVLHDSLSWAEELDAYLFVWLTCLGAAAGFKLRAHPEVRALVDRMPAPVASAMRNLADMTVIVLGLIFVIYGGQMIRLMGTETAASLSISMVYPYLAIPLAGGLLILHAGAHLALSYLSPEALRPAATGQDHAITHE